MCSRTDAHHLQLPHQAGMVLHTRLCSTVDAHHRQLLHEHHNVSEQPCCCWAAAGSSNQPAPPNTGSSNAPFQVPGGRASSPLDASTRCSRAIQARGSGAPPGSPCAREGPVPLRMTQDRRPCTTCTHNAPPKPHRATCSLLPGRLTQHLSNRHTLPVLRGSTWLPPPWDPTNTTSPACSTITSQQSQPRGASQPTRASKQMYKPEAPTCCTYDAAACG